jgi:two-component system, NtrC family, response regulator AtoC
MPGKWKDDVASTLGLHTPAGTRLSLAILDQNGLSCPALPASGSVTLGRDPSCEVRIEDASISRRHARVSVGPPLRLEDLGSKNGTRVRGKALQEGQPAPLEVGEAFEVGAVTVVLQRTPARPAVRAAGSPGQQPVMVSAGMRELSSKVDKVAPGDLNVLLLGETGVGKEVVARLLQQRSRRSARPLVCLSCAAIPESLLEAELFGYERGAFTGAQQAKPGLIESADGGTVLLDEVGELPMAVQVKLLRAIEEGKTTRLGGLGPKPARARFIAATNRDLKAEIEAGRFRQDLFFRLNGVTLRIPPLRQRLEDIEPLARAFAFDAAVRLDRPQVPDLSSEALAALMRYAWPGNVRELRNAIERAILFCGDGAVEVEHLPDEVRGGGGAHGPAGDPGSLRGQLQQLEREQIVRALEACDGNQSKAAAQMGMPRRTLLMRLDEYGIPRPRKGR